jgi:hypothetical protein
VIGRNRRGIEQSNSTPLYLPYHQPSGVQRTGERGFFGSHWIYEPPGGLAKAPVMAPASSNKIRMTFVGVTLFLLIRRATNRGDPLRRRELAI